MRLKMKLTALAAGATMLAAGSAGATITTFDITWSGASFGNSAVAHGFITLDAALLPEMTSGHLVILPDPRVTALSLDISGASASNGHFDLSDYLDPKLVTVSAVDFWAPATLNLGTELIGQDLGNSCTLGEITHKCAAGLGVSGDFNILSFGTLPAGVAAFTLSTSGQDQMLVTSIVAASVPEPAAWALMIGGFGGAGGLLQRRSTPGGLGLT
jgi:hypothetical protein